MGEHEFALLGIAMALAAAATFFVGYAAIIFVLIGLAVWVLSSFDEYKGVWFAIGAAIAGLLGYFGGSGGLIVALILGIVIAFVDFKYN